MRRLLLTFVLAASATTLTLWESPSHAAPPMDVPASAQTDSALDLPLDLPSSESAPVKDAPGQESTLFEAIPSVYGAAKYDQKVNEAPAAIIIITAEQIKKYG